MRVPPTLMLLYSLRHQTQSPRLGLVALETGEINDFQRTLWEQDMVGTDWSLSRPLLVRCSSWESRVTGRARR